MRALIIGAVVVLVLVVGYLVVRKDPAMTPQESEKAMLDYRDQRRAAMEKAMQEQAAKNPAPEQMAQ